MLFGQVVIGPPGAGKTTYCNGMQQFLELMGRKTAVVNMDPANDRLPYHCAVNIEELIKLEDVMTEKGLGPNGGLVYCMDFVEKNSDWLRERLQKLEKDGFRYVLFDFPGQVELFHLHSNVKNLLRQMIDTWHCRLVAVNLIDSFLCSDHHTFLSSLLLSLSTMMHLELPHVNVLSKIDLVEKCGPLAFNIEFYTEVKDLTYLQKRLKEEPDPWSVKHSQLTSALCEVVEDFSLVSFETLNIQDKESVYKLVCVLDRVNGYAFRSIESSVQEFNKVAVGQTQWEHERVADVEEKYVSQGNYDSPEGEEDEYGGEEPGDEI